MKTERKLIKKKLKNVENVKNKNTNDKTNFIDAGGDENQAFYFIPPNAQEWKKRGVRLEKRSAEKTMNSISI